MIENKTFFPETGEYAIGGYAKQMVDYTIENQLLDGDTWALFVNQFRIHSDVKNDWRGEFWGKMMRGGALTYRATKNEKLYKALTESIKDLLSVQEKSGRISARPQDNEFHAWDMWSRKYVILGCTYYLDICKNEAFKNKIINAMKKHADYIIKHVGEGKKQVSIYKTAECYGGLNSCSILEPFVKLYGLTKEQRYFDFATYIVEGGCCEHFNLIEACLSKDKYPFEFPEVKAYEMMSCLEGVLEYYKYTEKPEYLTAVKNFVDMVIESDYTIIGCSGCVHELFDNSSKTQTESVGDSVEQETCVTVTFMKLCAKLYAVTGDEKYVECIEKSGYNALFGAVNNENQTMVRTQGWAWKEVTNELYFADHEPFPFDSYSPLYMDRRGKRIGGFKLMENGRSYGCCACIGSAGTAIFGLFGVMKDEQGMIVNLYNDGKFKGEWKGAPVSVTVKANPYKMNGAKVTVEGGNKEFTLKLRVPKWAENFKVSVGGQEVETQNENGYFAITKVWDKEVVEIKYSAPVKTWVLNGKVAFTKGAITLARDIRLDDIKKPLDMTVKNGKTVRAKVVENTKFKSNLTVEIQTKDGVITLCDYSQAGKNYDDENSMITVWQDIKK